MSVLLPKQGLSPAQECCCCLPLRFNRSLHHFLGLCLTPSVMVHFPSIINNALVHTFILLQSYESF